MKDILRGKKIWHGDVTAKDTYVDFKANFKTSIKGAVRLKISCDSNYTVWVNGEVAAFAACADYPHYRNYDEINITRFCTSKKENVITITVWHYGHDSQTYVNSDAFLIFSITQRTREILKSDSKVLSRTNPYYKNGYCKNITTQLGFSFCYDSTLAETEYAKSEEHGIGEAVKRYRKTCKLSKSKTTAICRKVNGGYLVDLKKEKVGFPFMKFKSETEQKITVSYAEHLLPDGTVPRIIGDRDFSYEYIAKKGENIYLNTFRRIACRYLFVECDNESTVGYFGMKQVEYPVKERKRLFKDELLQRIYDTSVYTIKCCMHEHYEDCPWREQALYAMDSRNQMLCGYYMFDDKTYQRENLLLMSKGLKDNGLLSLCFPAGGNLSIPFFSLVYVMQVYEYVKYSGNTELLSEVKPVIDKIMQTFESEIDDNRLIPQFPAPHWNFYEWAEDSHNGDQIGRAYPSNEPKKYDLILNCMFVYVSGFYAKLTGNEIDTTDIKQAIKDTFFVKEKNAFKLSDKNEKLSVLGNSLAILAGVGNEELAQKVINGEGMIPVTLSMNTFKYDALLTFGDKYKEYIVNDMRKIFGKMLDDGATTFWETELGWKDFDNAGSLCHGWSAIPVYYLATLVDNQRL